MNEKGINHKYDIILHIYIDIKIIKFMYIYHFMKCISINEIISEIYNYSAVVHLWNLHYTLMMYYSWNEYQFDCKDLRKVTL